MKPEKGWIYFIYDPDPPPRGLIKIGKTKDVRKRFNTFRTANPNIRLIGAMKGYTDLESYLHEKFKRYRTAGEWFLPSKEILKTAKGGAMGNDDDFGDLFNPPAQRSPAQHPSQGNGWQSTSARIDPKFLKKYKESQDKERARKEYEKKRKKTNLLIDRIFWGFMLICLLTVATRIY